MGGVISNWNRIFSFERVTLLFREKTLDFGLRRGFGVFFSQQFEQYCFIVIEQRDEHVSLISQLLQIDSGTYVSRKGKKIMLSRFVFINHLRNGCYSGGKLELVPLQF